MLEKKGGLKFKAKIRIGALVGQDHGWFKWPNCAVPKLLSKIDPDMEFDCTELDGGRFDAVAPGFGIHGNPSQYGNGSLYIYSIDDLVVNPSVREEVLKHLRADKAKQLASAEDTANKLRAELQAIT